MLNCLIPQIVQSIHNNENITDLRTIANLLYSIIPINIIIFFNLGESFSYYTDNNDVNIIVAVADPVS